MIKIKFYLVLSIGRQPNHPTHKITYENKRQNCTKITFNKKFELTGLAILPPSTPAKEPLVRFFCEIEPTNWSVYRRQNQSINQLLCIRIQFTVQICIQHLSVQLCIVCNMCNCASVFRIRIRKWIHTFKISKNLPTKNHYHQLRVPLLIIFVQLHVQIFF